MPGQELVSQSIELPSGVLRLLQPQEAAELPDAGEVKWAPLAPYWAVLWRSGLALARELEGDQIVQLNQKQNEISNQNLRLSEQNRHRKMLLVHNFAVYLLKMRSCVNI